MSSLSLVVFFFGACGMVDLGRGAFVDCADLKHRSALVEAAQARLERLGVGVVA